MRCLKCNKEFNAEVQYCPFCGDRLSEQINNNQINSCDSANLSANLVNNDKLIPLTISREKRIMGFALSFNVFVDGVNLGSLKNGKSLTCQVGVGSHEILIKCVEKDVKQSINVLANNHSIEVITYARIGVLAAVAEIKDIIYK